jgi:hypothetical protein
LGWRCRSTIHADVYLKKNITSRSNSLSIFSPFVERICIYTSTLRGRGNSRCLKKIGYIDQEMVHICANIVCFRKISEVYFLPTPMVAYQSAHTHFDHLDLRNVLSHAWGPSSALVWTIG